MDHLIITFVTFFTVIDPIGTVPVFIAVTASSDQVTKRKMALKAALVAAGVLIFFIVVGELILDAIDIKLSAFQIAGGIILLLFALTMIFGESKPEGELKQIDNNDDKAIFPLAMPSLASPGAILAAIMFTENNEHSFSDQFVTTLIVLSVILIAWILMTTSTIIFRYIGNGGAAIISRVMGLILAAVAVSNILEGIKTYFNL